MNHPAPEAPEPPSGWRSTRPDLTARAPNEPAWSSSSSPRSGDSGSGVREETRWA